MKKKRPGKRKAFHHFTSNERSSLLVYLMQGMSVAAIAKRMRKDPSSIYRELIRGSQAKEGDGYQYGKRCSLLGKEYYICNQCPKHEKGCRRDKIYYNVNAADREAHDRRHQSNIGSKIGTETFWMIEEVVLNGVMKGQSLEHLWHTRPEIQVVSCTTIRRWIMRGLMKVKAIHLRRVKRFKKSYNYSKKRPNLAMNARIRAGRLMQDYLEFVKEHPDHILIQTDSVEGKKSDKRRLLTVMFVKTSVQLSFLYTVANSSYEVHSLLLPLMSDVRGRNTLPIVILTDNGPEFSDITALEEEVSDLHVFFADPYQSSDKAECERNHELIRYVLPKGYSFDGLTQEDVHRIMENINSYARSSIQWKKPVEIFRQALGDELLQKWHIGEIPSSEVDLRSKF